MQAASGGRPHGAVHGIDRGSNGSARSGASRRSSGCPCYVGSSRNPPGSFRAKPKPRGQSSKASRRTCRRSRWVFNPAGIPTRTCSQPGLQIDPIVESIRTLIAEQAPRLEASKARLDQLGPKPKEGEPEESPDAVKDRAEREAVVAEYDETQRLARAVLLQAEQLVRQIGDLRRSGFARALFEQSDSILSVALWKNVIEAIPRELRAQGTTFADVLDQISRNATFGALLLLGLAVGCAVALYEGRRMLSRRFVRRNPEAIDPARRSRLLAALTALFLGAVPVIVGCWIVWIAFDAADIFPPRLERVVAALLRGVAFIAFVRALIDCDSGA